VKKVLSFGLLSLVLLLAAPALATDYESLQATSVLVRMDKAPGSGSGSGTLVTKQVGPVTRTFVWTAGHVVAPRRQPDGSFQNLVIIHESRDKGRLIGTLSMEAKVIAYSNADTGEDLALLEVLEDNFRPVAVSAKFDLKGDIVPVGTELAHVGCTLGMYNSVSLGIMSQTDRVLSKNDRMFDQTTCMCYPGSSGGGIHRLDGTYIGMLTRGSGPGLNFIVPMRRILPWAKQMGIMWALDPAIAVPSSAERAKLPLSDGAEKAVPGIDEQRTILDVIRISIIRAMRPDVRPTPYCFFGRIAA